MVNRHLGRCRPMPDLGVHGYITTSIAWSNLELHQDCANGIATAIHSEQFY